MQADILASHTLQLGTMAGGLLRIKADVSLYPCRGNAVDWNGTLSQGVYFMPSSHRTAKI